VVDLQKDGLEGVGDQHVQSQDVEGHAVVVLLGLRRDVVVPQLFVTRDDCLH
jgi:hypothetical protein